MSLINKLTVSLLLLFVVYALPKGGFAHEPVTHEVLMTDQGFQPSSLKIKQGDSVNFKNTGQSPRWPASNTHPTHTIYPEFDPKIPIQPGKSWTFQFKKTGIWRFHDHLSSDLTGVIIVERDEDFVGAITPTSPPKPAKTGIWEIIIERLQGLFSFKQKAVSSPTAKKDPLIFSDDQKLLAYLKSAGPTQTIEYLHELELQGVGACHQQAHKAGRLSYELLGDKAFSYSFAQCHSGYSHGAIEAFFRQKGTENLAQNLRIICKKYVGNSFFGHQCFHGIGHGLTAWTNYDLPQSLSDCDLLDKGRESCYSGVFMENVVGGIVKEEAKDTPNKENLHFTKYLNNDPQYPCNSVAAKYKGACYFFQTSRMVQLFGADFSKIATICLAVPQEYQYLCFSSMGRDISGVHQTDLVSSAKECAYVSDEEMRTWCQRGVAENLLWDKSGQKNALAFCQLLKEDSEKDSCYEAVANRAKDLLSGAEFDAFCQKVEADFRYSCLEIKQISQK